ncbi:MAG: ribosomal protein [Bacillota bacterium]|jgi:ribosomal protein L7Ae-like RNA K-turn-binding protein|nr:ribosomal protein [Bacillota bacterium]
MRKKVDSYLGFAAKSKNLVSGYQSCLHAIKHRKLKLIIFAEDLSENTVKKLSRVADESAVPIRIYGDSEELSQITGNQDRGIFGITDGNFAEAIMKEIDGK